MTPYAVHTRKITFELFDEHPQVGHYCVFANETVDKTTLEDLDFIYVAEIMERNGEKFVCSPDLHVPVMLKYCWRLKISVHD